jgi:lanosterol synthase
MLPPLFSEPKITSGYSKREYWNCWKLKTSNGRQVWEFELPEKLLDLNLEADSKDAREFLDGMSNAFTFDKSRNPNAGDKVYRAQVLKDFAELPVTRSESPPHMVTSLQQDARQAALKGLHFYKCLQSAEGHFPGDYGGPLFLLPGLIIASCITETPFPAPHRELMKRYMLNHQNADGGWGLHIEGRSTMFGTVMQYVALRILGMKPEHLKKSRDWILQNGGATGVPSWGKFYLAVLGVYEWDGCNSLFPELWLLPWWLPIHPSRYWCHSRMVYLPMAYCYGNRITGKQTSVVRELKNELYTQDYQSITWSRARNEIAKADSYVPQSALLKAVNRFVNYYEQFHSATARKRALEFILSYINAEDEQTDYVDIGPVNQIINSICVWHAYGKNSIQFHKHVERWKDYLWVAEDGMKMNGYNGSQ